MKPIRLVAASAILLLAGFASPQSDDPLTIGYSKIWIGQYSAPEAFPIRVDLENIGPGELVQLIARSGSVEVMTPVEMPQGAEKTVEMYLPSEQFGSPQLFVKRGLLESAIPIDTMGPSWTVSYKIALISDQIGDLTMLRRPPGTGGPNPGHNNPRTQIVLEDMSAKPGEAPTRSIGYWGIDTLFLGEGSERLTDAEVDAIKAAVLQGLDLVFVGGSIRPVFADPRWQALLPVHSVGPAENRTFSAVSQLVSMNADFSLPMLELQPSPMTHRIPESGDPVMVYRTFGNGSISIIAFDPFMPQVKNWNGRFALFSYFGNRFQIGGTPTPTGGFEDIGYHDDVGVFRVNLPSSGKIAIILFGYLLIVAPLNFLVLRKLRRGELAWITAPLLAVGCAVIIFGFASQLYGAQASRASSGVLFGASGSNGLVGTITQQLYFPSSGTRDLGLKNVEYVTSASFNDPRFGNPTMNKFIDVGQVIAPNYSVSNLSFREFAMVQRIPMEIDLATAQKLPNGMVRVELRNPFSHPMASIFIRSGKSTQRLAMLESGQTHTVDIKPGEQDAIELDLYVKVPELGAQHGTDVSSNPFRIYYTVAVQES